MIRIFNFYYKALITSLKKLVRSPILTIFNIVIFSFLIGFLIITCSLIKSNNRWASHIMSYPKMVIYLKDNNKIGLDQILNYLQKNKASVTNFRYLSSNDAIKEFVTQDNQNITFDDNIIGQIPSLIILDINNSIKHIDNFKQELEQFDIVQSVYIDKLYIDKINNMNNIINFVLSGLIIFIITILVLIIYHNIKIKILTGRDEIKIQKLIGATNYFILLPILFVEVIQIIIALFLAYSIYQLTLKHFNLLLTKLLSIIEAKITLIELSHLDIIYISGLVIVLTIITTYTSVQSILAKNTNY